MWGWLICDVCIRFGKTPSDCNCLMDWWCVGMSSTHTREWLYLVYKAKKTVVHFNLDLCWSKTTNCWSQAELNSTSAFRDVCCSTATRPAFECPQGFGYCRINILSHSLHSLRWCWLTPWVDPPASSLFIDTEVNTDAPIINLKC